MPTEKTRINVTLSREVDMALTKVARRDRVPLATKAAELLATALEIEEDFFWNRLAIVRDKKETRFIAHDKAWL